MALCAFVALLCQAWLFTQTYTQTHNTHIELQLALPDSLFLKEKDTARAQESNKEETRGQFWIHIGPPKTATSTLQLELQRMQDEGILKKDGYAYMGKFFKGSKEDPVRNGELLKPLVRRDCQVELAKWRWHNQLAKNNNTISPSTIPCWEPVLGKLHELRQQGIRHVIVSDELLGFRHHRRWFVTNSSSFVAALDYKALKLSLGTHYDIRIVVSYRRYYEWLVSAKLHHEKYSPSKPAMNRWSGNVMPLFPTILNRKIDHYRYTDVLVNDLKQQSHVSFHIFNIHDKTRTNSSLQTSFLCNVLSNTPASCQTSHLMDKEVSKHRVANAASSRNTEVESMYDRLVTTAAKRDLFPTDGLQRRNVVLRAIKYHQNSLSSAPFPLICPNEQELELLLNRSVDMELQIFGASYDTTPTKFAFKESFASDQKLCTINVESVLADPSWQSFFSGLNKNKK